MKTETRNQWDTIASIVMRNLPTDVDGRRRVLDALVEVMPGSAPRAAEVKTAWRHITAHICAQREFQLEPETIRGSGRLSDQPIVRGSTRLGDRPVARGSARLSDKTLVK